MFPRLALDRTLAVVATCAADLNDEFTIMRNILEEYDDPELSAAVTRAMWKVYGLACYAHHRGGRAIGLPMERLIVEDILPAVPRIGGQGWMKDLPYYRMWVKDFDTNENVRLLDLTEAGLFVFCLNHSWVNDGLPESQDDIARALKIPHDVFLQLWPRVSKCFFLDESGRLRNRRQEEERDHACKKSKQAADAVTVRESKRIGRSSEMHATIIGRSSDDHRKSDSRSSDDDLRARARADSDSVYVPEDLFFDAETEFQRLWGAYPAKGRVDFTLSQSYFCEEITDAETFAAAFGSVTTGKWAKSDKWAKGFIKALPAWIHNRAWETEDPEPAGGQQSEIIESTMDPETARRIKAARRG